MPLPKPGRLKLSGFGEGDISRTYDTGDITIAQPHADVR